MNICFITAGPIEWASSRMRAYWVADALRERGHDVTVLPFDKYSDPNSESLLGADVFIFQKKADVQNLVWLKVNNKKLYWDVCDPSWWWQPDECREIARRMTAVVASSQALADDFNDWYGEKLAICIPDRLKLSHFHTQRQHRDVSPVRLIWFGIAANRVALWGARANLERLVANGYKIELTIFDDRPDVPFRMSDMFPIYHVRWELSKEVEVLASHDIALLPPYPGPWGKVKSNNKALTAVSCGLPYETGNDYELLESLVSYPAARGWEAAESVKGMLDVTQSAIEWEALLS